MIRQRWGNAGPKSNSGPDAMKSAWLACRPRLGLFVSSSRSPRTKMSKTRSGKARHQRRRAIASHGSSPDAMACTLTVRLEKTVDSSGNRKGHFECRWNCEQPPAFAHVDQHAQTARARDVVRVARDRKSLWKDVLPIVSWAANTPCIQHVAPKRRFIRQHGLAGAQQCAMPGA